MAKHELVCVRAYTTPEQVLAPMRVVSLCTGADLGAVGGETIIPAKHYPVGARTTCSRKPDALRLIKTGNWEYAR